MEKHHVLVAVLGAGGFVGSAIAAECAARGLNVRPVHAPRLDSYAGDAADLIREARSPAASAAAAHLAAEFSGVDVVVNAAGLATPRHAGSPALTGANALLPCIVAAAAAQAGVHRVIQLSSAAVQGHRPVLDESAERAPFSAYSRSKSLGEEALLKVGRGGTEAVILRATSVQGPGRPTTAALAKLAASPLASVAAPGTAATPVSSINALAWFTAEIALHAGSIPQIVLQPWEGLSVTEVLAAAGGRKPLKLPTWLCRAALSTGYFLSRLAGERLHGSLRRLELMWFGQAQQPGWAEQQGLLPQPQASAVLRQAAAQQGTVHALPENRRPRPKSTESS
ncbi:NAD-dependent epimerase/dehydratase family protein [Paeniglutamicibacter antarcticus]|uniref:NAD-dependent epimerase/dehydratase family protein n=2 Tax=Arthrobacter terrae TaxID=2935737 RepID=A0A931CN34_9MICC|nr:NAD-dependent epimerase/dehydratase family protein [Arthrobacter terrae]